MPFVPDFDCDVFVSYATANNQEPFKWVTAFRDVLKSCLNEGLDQRDVGEIWMDYKLAGAERFDDQIREKVTKSAVLLIVLSEAYLKSTWCAQSVNFAVWLAARR